MHQLPSPDYWKPFLGNWMVNASAISKWYLNSHQLSRRTQDSIINFFQYLVKPNCTWRSAKTALGLQRVTFLVQNKRTWNLGIQTQMISFDASTKWPVPKSVTEVRQFFGLPRFYRLFVKRYANKVRLIIDLLQKNKFEWGLEQGKAFRRLKTALFAPVLVHP